MEAIVDVLLISDTVVKFIVTEGVAVVKTVVDNSIVELLKFEIE